MQNSLLISIPLFIIGAPLFVSGLWSLITARIRRLVPGSSYDFEEIQGPKARREGLIQLLVVIILLAGGYWMREISGLLGVNLN